MGGELIDSKQRKILHKADLFFLLICATQQGSFVWALNSLGLMINFDLRKKISAFQPIELASWTKTPFNLQKKTKGFL